MTRYFRIVITEAVVSQILDFGVYIYTYIIYMYTYTVHILFNSHTSARV